MEANPLWKLALSFVFVSIFIQGCTNTDNENVSSGLYESNQTQPEKGDWVIVGIRSEPDALNPFNYRSGEASEVMSNMFHSLLSPDTISGTPQPELVISKPEVSDDLLRYTFELRNDATWDNGDPITAEDVEFTTKYFKNPNVAAPHIRQIHSYLSDVEMYPDNPLKFTFILDEPFFLAEWYLGDMFVLPKHVYDPDGLMDNFSVRQLDQNDDLLLKESDLIRFGELANSEKYQRDPSFIQGSGAYQLEEWVTGQTVKLKRKENWWGDKLEGSAYTFNNWPEKIIYKVTPNPETQIAELKQQNIDVMASLPTRDYEKLKNDSLLNAHYRFSTEPTYVYTLFGMNCRPPSSRTPFFADKRVRHAMGYLLNIDQMIDQIYYNMGEKITSPIHPSRPEYNDQLRARPFDMEKGKQLLDEAGWIDSDGDGIRDKIINGKLTPFSFEFSIASASGTAKPLALIMQEDLKKAGIDLIIVAKEFKLMSDDFHKHSFDMAGMAFGFSSFPPDMAQLWHTDSWETHGTNYFGFGTEESDSLIESIRKEPNETIRKEMYNRIQEIIFDEAPCIFLMVPLEKYAVHKRFRSSNTHPSRPGYTVRGFWTPRELIRYPEAIE